MLMMKKSLGCKNITPTCMPARAQKQRCRPDREWARLQIVGACLLGKAEKRICGSLHRAIRGSCATSPTQETFLSPPSLAISIHFHRPSWSPYWPKCEQRGLKRIALLGLTGSECDPCAWRGEVHPGPCEASKSSRHRCI